MRGSTGNPPFPPESDLCIYHRRFRFTNLRVRGKRRTNDIDRQLANDLPENSCHLAELRHLLVWPDTGTRGIDPRAGS